MKFNHLFFISFPPFITPHQGWVGALLVYQPFYVSGLEDIGAAKSSAFGALGLFIVTFASSIVYLCYDSCCKFRYGALSTHDTDAGVGAGGGVGYPRGMSEYEVNIEMADAVAQRMGEPRIRLSGGSGTAGGMRQRRPYSDTPYSDEPPARGSSSGYRDVPPEAAPASGNSAHSAPITPSGPRVMVAGMPRSNSTASAVSSSTPTGNLLGLGDDGDDDGSGSGSSEEEGDWAATSGAGSAPSSGNGPVDLLS